MRIIVEGRRLTRDVCEADIPPQDLDLFAEAPRSEGETSVLLLPQPPEELGGQLAFTPGSVVVLNRGSTPRAILVSSPSSETQKEETRMKRSGDQEFLAELPSSLRSLGSTLLAEVRKRWPGGLKSTPSGRFIETPDNFWTVKIQPRDKSLRLTVRGEPERLGGVAELGLRADRPGYSTFKVSQLDQIALALTVLTKAPRR